MSAPAKKPPAGATVWLVVPNDDRWHESLRWYWAPTNARRFARFLNVGMREQGLTRRYVVRKAVLS